MNTANQTLELPDTKRRLLDAGVDLMRRQGFNATTVDSICAEASVTKGGFFHYFKSKEDLAGAAMTRFSEGKTREYADAPFRKLADPLDRVYGRLDFAAEASGGRNRLTKGCLIGMFAQELSATNPELRGLCQQSFARMAGDFTKDLTEARALHAPNADFEPKNVAMLYLAIIQGSLMLAKAAEANAVLLENLNQFRRYLQQLFGLPARAGAKKTSASRN